MTRKQLNYNIRRYAHYVLKLDEDQYREIVDTVTNKRHITDCTQEEAELVFAALKNFSRAGGRQRMEVPTRRNTGLSLDSWSTSIGAGSRRRHSANGSSGDPIRAAAMPPSCVR